jgi:hypothetical protein
MGKKDKLSVRKETRKSSEPVSIPAVVSTVKRTKVRCLFQFLRPFHAAPLFAEI